MYFSLTLHSCSHTHSSCRCSYFFIVLCMLVYFLFLLSSCVFEKLWENQKKIRSCLFLAFISSLISSSIKRKPKKISRVCWELSRVNSFSRSCFTFLRKTKNPKIFQCVSLQFFSFLWGSRGEDHDENVEWLSYALLLI